MCCSSRAYRIRWRGGSRFYASTPWHSTKRLIKTPKLHCGDIGLACNLLRCSAAELHDQRELLGQLLETFVFGEIERQASAFPERIALHHLRDKDGYEVDSSVVLYDGEHVLPFGERLLAVPLSALWARSPRATSRASIP